MKTATLTNIVNGKSVEVYATTEHSASSYGIPVWVDSEGQAYCQVGSEAPFYEVRYNIDEVLKEARESSGLTIRALSEKTGINASNLSRIERGEISPTVETLQKIASALGLQLRLE